MQEQHRIDRDRLVDRRIKGHLETQPEPRIGVLVHLDPRTRQTVLPVVDKLLSLHALLGRDAVQRRAMIKRFI